MENLQVVRYTDGQEFRLHTDHIPSFNDLDCRGRLATCLVYLNSSYDSDNDSDNDRDNDRDNGVDSSANTNANINGNTNSLTFEGGCTFFPEYGARITPKCGRAVFWFNTIERPGAPGYGREGDNDMDMDTDTKKFQLSVDLRSRHSGEPVYNGEKWVCNRWVHPVPLDTGVRD